MRRSTLALIALWALLIFLMISGLTGCGRGHKPVERKFTNIDPAFVGYYEEFYAATGINPFKVNIGFVNALDGPAIGKCYINSTFSEIAIVKRYWLSLEYREAHRQELIFHELGHCLLKRMDHVEETFEDGCPKSIMMPHNFGDPCYFRYYNHYIKELISGDMQETP